jgi:GNAT superfamily N-acetyltransferase
MLPPRPLSESDERASFDCGRESLNAWFRRHAWSNHVNGASRVNVITETATGNMIGYVTLSAAQIEQEFFPKGQQRNRPSFIPVTLLGQLAVHKEYRGQGHATSLLLFALKTALRAAENVGSAGVITHPIDDEMRRFCARWGFEDLPFDPRRAMIVRMVDLEKNLGE